MSTVINAIEMNGAWYETDNRRRDGKTKVTMTFCDEAWIAQLKDNLSKPVKCLNLSPKLLFYLMHYKIVFPSMEQVGAFNERLDNFSYGKMEQFMRRRDRKMVWIAIPPSSLYKKHQKILYEAITYIHQHYPWKLRNCLPDRFKEFRAISETIIHNTNPKEIKWGGLSQKQKEWIRLNGGGGTIKNIFEYMVCEYTEMVDQLSKYRIMSGWLEEQYPHLYDFYLHGRRRYAQKERVSLSIRERLKSLGKLVNSTDDLLICETAIRQLQYLIENDLLFTSVFYSYFYKRERGKPRVLKRKALEKAKLLIYLLKFFNIQPIDHNGIKIKSIYDLGVLLLNALAGEKIYKTERYDPLADGEGGADGRYFKFKGALLLYRELDPFRRAWRQLN